MNSQLKVAILASLLFLTNWVWILIFYKHARVLDLSDYQLLDIVIAIIGSGLTVLFLIFIWSQIINQKKDLSLKNDIETFKQLDDFYFNRIIKYEKLTKKIDDMGKNKQIQFTNEEIEQIEDLLNLLETFAIKRKELNLDIRLVYEYSGSMILNLIENPEVENKFLSLVKSDKNNFTYLTDMRSDLKRIKD